MPHRLFIALNLPKEIKYAIEEVISELQPLLSLSEKEIKFVPKENWHITVLFLGYQSEKLISIIEETIKNNVKKYLNELKKLKISLENIKWGPDIHNPRMIWLCGDKASSNILETIKNSLIKDLLKKGIKIENDKPLNTHITLLRFQHNSFLDIKNIKLPEFNIKEFFPSSIDLMESHLKSKGPDYEILSKIDINQAF